MKFSSILRSNLAYLSAIKDKIFLTSNSIFKFNTIRITPAAALRSAYGSLLPVGILFILNSPISVSSLEDNATILEK